MTTWEDLDAMVEGDPLALRDRAWREIRTRDLRIAGLEAARDRVLAACEAAAEEGGWATLLHIDDIRRLLADD